MGILIIICILAIGILGMNIKAVQRNPYISIRVICTLLFILSMIRYITLLLFAKAPSLELISQMQGFYYISIIGISIPLLLVMWYITPFYREKIRPLGLILISLPHVLLYIGILVCKPFQEVKSQAMGYSLRLTGNWELYLASIYTVFILAYIILALYGFKLYKHRQTRSQYLVLIMCQILFLIDGFTYFSLVVPSIPVFTLTEAFAFLGIYYGLSKATIDARGRKMT